MSETVSPTVMRRALALLAALALGISLLPTVGSPASAAPSAGGEPASVHPQLEEEFAAAEDGTVQAVLVFDDQADVASLAGDRDAVVAELRRVADQSKERFEAQVAEMPAEFVPDVVNWNWLANMALVEFPADLGALETVTAMEGVQRAVPNFELTLIEPEPGSEMGTAIVDDRTWGVDRIEAHRVHEELGLDGSDIRVATLDTGVDIDHQDLTGKMVTDDPSDPNYPGGWMEFDADGNLVSSAPYDTQYHGTHVAGTIHGGDASDVQIGVAPGADMMHGLVIPGGGGSFMQVAAGMEWAVDPVDADGNPAGEPADIVNMSLGAPGFHDEMIEPTRNMVAAGVFPAFAIGNSCGVQETGSPGNVYEAVAVGATDEGDSVASFSCGGTVQSSDWANPPADWPEEYIKPEISAPGVDTYSAMPGDDYDSLSGTSMAAPHTAGTAALMLEAAPDLDVDALLDQMADTAFFDDRHGDERPNDRFGYGRINAFDATEPIALDSGIEGTVTDSETGDPIEGATVTEPDSGRTSTTDEDGEYTLRLEPGTYDLEADAFGYDATTESGVEVPDDETFVTQDLALDPAPAGSITGTVTLEDSGIGIPGVHIDVLETPLDTSTGSDGAYSISEIAVGTYEVEATHPLFPETDTVTVEVQDGETATADFTFEAPAGGDLALVTSDPGNQLADYFADLDMEPSFYRASELADIPLADYDAVIWAYEILGEVPEDDVVQGFIADAEAMDTGLVFLDQAFTTGNGIRALSEATGQPESTDDDTGGAGADTSFYEVVEQPDHPLFDGIDVDDVGDRIPYDATDQAKWIAWFDGYSDGDRTILADAGRDDDQEIYGGGIGVNDLGRTGHALLSLHAPSATRGPAEWTDEAETLFLNAIQWVSPPDEDDQPVFVTSELEVDPDVVLSGEPVDISATITNVGTEGGEHNARLLIDGSEEDTETVSLDPDESTEVSWTVTRDEIGTYDVEVGTETDEFRVRAPEVDLSALTVDGEGYEPEPLADATVELLHDGELLEMGTTDGDGELSFEAPTGDAEYTLIVRREATDDHEYAYLLTRPERVDDDTSIEVAPRTMATADGMGALYAWNLSAVIDLDVDAVDDDHEAWTYLRHGLVEPYGFAFEPGPVVATIADADGFEAVHAHAITGLERDWWFTSEILDDLPWQDPIGYEHTFGGDATAELDSELTNDTEFAASWDVLDAHGNPFEAMMATDLRPFAEVPEVLELEDVTSTLLGEAPNPAEVLMRLYDPDGEAVHAGGLDWDERVVERDLEDLVDEVRSGSYGLEVEVDTGPWSGTVSDDSALTIAGADRSIDPEEIEAGDEFTGEITFAVAADGDIQISDSIAEAGTDAGSEAIGNGWPVADWDASVEADYDGNGTWTIADDAVEPGDEVTLTYTVLSPLNVSTPSTWHLDGTVAIGDDVDVSTGGDHELEVVSTTSAISPAPDLGIGGWPGGPVLGLYPG